MGANSMGCMPPSAPPLGVPLTTSTATTEPHSQALLGSFHGSFDSPVRSLGMSVAHQAMYWDDPVVFAFNYAFWDHWWTNNRTLGRCGCAAVGGCRGAPSSRCECSSLWGT